MFTVSKYIGDNLSFGVGASFNSISKYATGLELSETTKDYFNVLENNIFPQYVVLNYDINDKNFYQIMGFFR